MAKGDNALTYLALAAAAYWLYSKQTAPQASTVAPSPALAVPGVIDQPVGPLPGQRQPFYKPILRLPKENTITLPAGQAPPAAPTGYYWARAASGNPAADGSVTYSLLQYEYHRLDKPFTTQ